MINKIKEILVLNLDEVFHNSYSNRLDCCCFFLYFGISYRSETYKELGFEILKTLLNPEEINKNKANAFELGWLLIYLCKINIFETNDLEEILTPVDSLLKDYSNNIRDLDQTKHPSQIIGFVIYILEKNTLDEAYSIEEIEMANDALKLISSKEIIWKYPYTIFVAISHLNKIKNLQPSTTGLIKNINSVIEEMKTKSHLLDVVMNKFTINSEDSQVYKPICKSRPLENSNDLEYYIGLILPRQSKYLINEIKLSLHENIKSKIPKIVDPEAKSKLSSLMHLGILLMLFEKGGSFWNRFFTIKKTFGFQSG